jgi:hypothetical protein
MDANVVYCTYKVINQYEVESESECDAPQIKNEYKTPLIYKPVLKENKIIDEIL